MTFQNYNTKNDAISTLLAGISASATSVQVQSADGVKFPTGNFVATIIQYTNKLDRNSAIVKKEKVLVSTNATDTFTITRGFGGDTPTAFETGDTIVLNVVSEVIEDIQDEVARLESDKLNKGGLRTALTNTWKMFFSNGSNNETELAFGSFGRVLQSNGATSAPTWEVPTVDINTLGEDTSGNLVNDFFIKNNGTGGNTKIKLTRYKATTSDINVGTNDEKYVSPAQIESTRKVTILQGTRNIGDATGTQVIAHGLGFAPKWIEITAYTSANTRQMNINGYSNGSVNMCSGQNFNYNVSNDLYPFNNNSNAIYLYIDLSSGAGNWLTRATVTFDITNITLNWTTTGSQNPGGIIYYTIIAHS